MLQSRRMPDLARLVLLLALLPVRGEPALHGLSIALNGREVAVSFRLENGFQREVVERLESGLPTGFSFDLQLMRDRAHWWDEELDASRFEVVAMFNAVTREYLVNTKKDGRLIDSKTLRDEGDLARAMTVFTALPAFTLDNPSPHERYLVRARVETGTTEILGVFPHALRTPWLESNKVRVREP